MPNAGALAYAAAPDNPRQAFRRRGRVVHERGFGGQPRRLCRGARFRLDMKALVRTVAEDRATGFNPVAVCANAGATSTGAVDPLEAMAHF